MKISDEEDLMGRLDRAFQAISPSQAPVERAVRQGRVIRVRRRLVAAAGLAIVAAGIAVPVLLHQQAAPPSLGQIRYPHVTVQPPGPHAPAGLIASGTVNGRHWAVTAEKPGTGGAGQGNQCFMALSVQGCLPVNQADPANPVGFTGLTSGSLAAQYGRVATTVSYVIVRLADGETLILHPVSVLGVRYVAFAAPRHTAITSITAYSAHGELAAAVPFNAPSGGATVNLWLRPGQRGLPRASHLVASGTAGGHVWSVTGYVGPWGRCLVAHSQQTLASTCAGTASDPGTSVMGWTAGPPRLAYGSASADVEHVIITLAGGGTIRVPAVPVGDQKFFSFAVGRSQHAVRWQAYDGARREVASGRLKGL